MGGDGGQVFSSFRAADPPAPTGLHGTADRALRTLSGAHPGTFPLA